MRRMSDLFKRLMIFASCLGVFLLVVFYIPAPASWQEASVFQIMAFFLPLLLGFTILFDFLVHYSPHSFILSLGLILALAFYAVNQLSILSGLLVILITLLSWRVTPRMKLPRFRLTRSQNIPKLHMQKQELPKKRHRLRRIRR